MSRLLSLTILLLASPVFAQSVQILDSVTRQPIAYAHLVYLSQAQQIGGLYSNTAGQATVVNLGAKDSLLISCMGYNTKVLAATNLADTIYLASINTALDEVWVTSAKAKTTYLGVKQGWGGSAVNAGFNIQYVTLIDNPYQEEKKVISFVFKIRRSWSSDSAYLKLLFFENVNGRPGEQLDAEVIFYSGDSKKRKIKIDLMGQNLFLPKDGLFAGVEWLGCKNGWHEPKNNRVHPPCNLSLAADYVPKKESPNPTFYRHSQLMDKWTEGFWFFESDQLLVPRFGLLVFE